MLDRSSRQFSKVYELVRQIPKGKVTTYGAIAKKLSMSPRVVGYALHLNPNGSKTPCHRVVNRNGRLAPGYAFGGKDEQKRRLEQEGIKFIDKQRIELEKYLFSF
ncbi:MAG: MGMT family protein [Candidatus Levybacteria bacterium]|nr:MGMT family protein [Candidatus Levybacteria bacterium]